MNKLVSLHPFADSEAARHPSCWREKRLRHARAVLSRSEENKKTRFLVRREDTLACHRKALEPSIGDENARLRSRFPRRERSNAMIIKRRRFKQETSLQDRIVEWAIAVRKQAAAMRPGPERDELLKKLRQAETAMRMEKWANSPGLQPPK